jgi:endoglucanase
VLPALVAALACAVATLVGAGAPADGAKDPRLTRSVYVDPSGASAKAAAKDTRFARIGTRGQAFWVTDAYPTSSVRRTVEAYATRAQKARRTPLVAVYAIPGRDCGQHSAGGLSPSRYRAWVAQVAAGLKGRNAMVVLEPDAVALMGTCDGQGDRAALLRDAVARFRAAGAWVYLDAGHSSWLDPDVVAARLVASGIGNARGFATNVSNFRSTADETAYAGRVLSALKTRGVTGRRYVVDTSRNGASRPPAAADFCNPREARIGRAPGIVDRSGLDAYVWVKRPGESDGTCQGGPAAGRWWPTGALRLLGS